jgi:hypothetical protein
MDLAQLFGMIRDRSKIKWAVEHHTPERTTVEVDGLNAYGVTFRELVGFRRRQFRSLSAGVLGMRRMDVRVTKEGPAKGIVLGAGDHSSAIVAGGARSFYGCVGSLGLNFRGAENQRNPKSKQVGPSPRFHESSFHGLGPPHHSERNVSARPAFIRTWTGIYTRPKQWPEQRVQPWPQV